MTTILITGGYRIVCKPFMFSALYGIEPHLWGVRPEWWGLSLCLIARG